MSGDRLAQIEAHALSVEPFQRTMARAPGVMAADVLALVEIARSAEYAEGVLMRDPFDETQRRYAAQVLREALARLDSGATEGDA